MVVSPPKPPAPPANDQQRDRNKAYAAEAGGLLVVGIILLVFIIARYWSSIHWNMR